jgi:hypothetical protein
VATAGAVAVALTSFLPWATSGRASRSSYELVASAERLEVLDGVAAAAAPLWYLVPLAAACAFLAAVLGRTVLAAGVAAATGVAAIVLGAAVNSSPLGADVGCAAATLAGAVSVAGAAVAVWQRRRR